MNIKEIYEIVCFNKRGRYSVCLYEDKKECEMKLRELEIVNGDNKYDMIKRDLICKPNIIKVF